MFNLVSHFYDHCVWIEITLSLSVTLEDFSGVSKFFPHQNQLNTFISSFGMEHNKTSKMHTYYEILEKMVQSAKENLNKK